MAEDKMPDVLTCSAETRTVAVLHGLFAFCGPETYRVMSCAIFLLFFSSFFWGGGGRGESPQYLASEKLKQND